MHYSTNADLVEQQQANDDKTLAQPKTAFKPSKIDLPRESDSDGNTLCNVHYSGYDTPTTPTFVNCRLENVHFINCKFRDTEFRNVKLVNVAFINIDIQNATIYNIDFQEHSWKDIVARNLMLVSSSLPSDAEARVTSLMPYRPISNDHLTYTVIETRPIDKLSPGVAKRLWRHEKGFRHSIHIEQLPRPRLLDRLMDHEHIMSRIIDSLTLMLDDDQVYSGKDKYEGSVRKIFSCVVTFWYQIPSNLFKSSGTVYLYCPKSTGPWHLATLAWLHVNRDVQDRLTYYCQGPLDRAQCHVSNADRYITQFQGKIPHLSSANTVVLHYNFKSDRGFLATNDETWHNLLAYLRHEASHISDVHLIIDKGFWDLALDGHGVTAVLAQNGLRNSPNPRRFPNFLTKVTMIAAPASRWYDHDLKRTRESKDDYDLDEDYNHCAQGTRLEISIEGAVSEERQAFVRRLARRIDKMRVERPFHHWNACTYTREPRPWWDY